MNTSIHTSVKRTHRMHDVLKVIVVLACLFDVGCVAEGMALVMGMMGAGTQGTSGAASASGMPRPGSARPTGSMPTNFDPLAAASRSQPPGQVVSNGPVQRSPGGFNPVSDTFPAERHFGGGDLIASAPERSGGGEGLPLGAGDNNGGGQLGGPQGFANGM